MERASEPQKLAVICGGRFLKEIRTYAVKHGLHLITIHKRPDAFVHRFSDEQWYEDCTDGDVILPLLSAHGVDAIFACADEKLLRKCLDWIFRSDYPFYATRQQWDILMNKRNFKQYASQFGIPVIPAYCIESGDGIPVEPLTFPVVVKPADNSGSSGIRICTTKEQLQDAVSFAQMHSVSGQILCEKYMTGSFFQFEIWMQDGTAYFPYTKDRVFYPQHGSGPQQPFLDLYPSSYNEILETVLFSKIRNMMLSLGIKNGSCMFQGILHDGIPYIMDTAFRLSAGMDHRIVQAEKHADLIAAQINYALHGTFSGDFRSLTAPFQHVYATLCIGLQNGTVTAVSGMEKIRELPFVYDCAQYYDIGYIVKNSGTFAQIGFRFFMSAESRSQLRGFVADILALLHVRNEKGESMLLDSPSYFA